MLGKKEPEESLKFLNEKEESELKQFDLRTDAFSLEDECISIHLKRLGLEEEVYRLKISHLQMARMKINERKKALDHKKQICKQDHDDFGNSVKERLGLDNKNFSYDPDTLEVTST